MGDSYLLPTGKELALQRADDLLVRYASRSVLSVTTACPSCHAEMHGEWQEDEPPYILNYPGCSQSYTIHLEESHKKGR